MGQFGRGRGFGQGRVFGSARVFGRGSSLDVVDFSTRASFSTLVSSDVGEFGRGRVFSRRRLWTWVDWYVGEFLHGGRTTFKLTHV